MLLQTLRYYIWKNNSNMTYVLCMGMVSGVREVDASKTWLEPADIDSIVGYIAKVNRDSVEFFCLYQRPSYRHQ